MVMNHVSDLKVLLSVAAVFPDVTSEAEHRGDNPVPSFMSLFLPAELHQLANAVSILHPNFDKASLKWLASTFQGEFAESTAA